jgi:hypothetical protein
MAILTVTAAAARDEARIIRRLTRLARTMDTALKIPGTKLRFGADSVIGLIPGAGDLVGLGISSYVLLEAWRLGAPGAVLIRMAGNVAIDTGLGAVPLVGDVFDLFFKSNTKNLTLLLDHLEETGRIKR